MNVTVILSDSFGFKDSREFNSLAAAAWYAWPFALIGSYVVVFRFQ